MLSLWVEQLQASKVNAIALGGQAKALEANALAIGSTAEAK